MTLHLTPSTLRAAALVSLLGWAGPGAANDSAAGYPSKPVKLIVASTAGSSPDVVTRLIAEQLSAQLGRAVLVDNHPGAGQTIAVKALAASEPDGHTLLLGTTGGLAINPALYRHLDLSVSKSFVPVALMVTIPNVLAVASTVPANTLGELVAYAKANPGKLSFGASQGTPLQLLGEYVRAKSGMDTVYVPYKGGSQALPDLLAGRIQIGADGLSLLLPHIREGKVRALAVTSTTRLPEIPDVPTLAEVGIDGYPPQTFMGLVAPAGTPRAIVSKLNAVVNDVLRSATLRASLAKLGFKEAPGSPDDFARLIATDAEKWAAVVALSGAKGE
jgi:tripartite-type tricarboxylate transporter receptor subunit TctC